MTTAKAPHYNENSTSQYVRASIADALLKFGSTGSPRNWVRHTAKQAPTFILGLTGKGKTLLPEDADKNPCHNRGEDISSSNRKRDTWQRCTNSRDKYAMTIIDVLERKGDTHSRISGAALLP